MITNNQNFIIGLISAVALVVGLISTFISIHKTNLEIRKLQLENQKQKNTSPKKSVKHSQNDIDKVRVVVEFLFFLLFSIGSISVIVEYLANRVPIFGFIVTHFFVLIYSLILLVDNTPSPNISKKEQQYFTVAGLVGMLITLALNLMLGIQRLMAIPNPNDTTIVMIFSVLVNLEIVPLLSFSLISLHRLIRYASNNIVISQ